MASVEYCDFGDWVQIEINNPRYHNCMTGSMWRQLETIAKQMQQSSKVRAVLIRGAGEHFTSGFDLGELAELGFDDVNQEFSRMENAIAAVEGIGVPVIAVLQGYCLGGGLELALAADLRISDRSVQMGMPIARIGIMLSAAFALRLVKVLGLGKAKELLLTGHLLGAEEGHQMGLINQVSDVPEQLSSLATSWVDDIRSLYSRAVRQAKISVSEVLPLIDNHPPYFVDQEDFFCAIKQFKRS